MLSNKTLIFWAILFTTSFYAKVEQTTKINRQLETTSSEKKTPFTLNNFFIEHSIKPDEEKLKKTIHNVFEILKASNKEDLTESANNFNNGLKMLGETSSKNVESWLAKTYELWVSSNQSGNEEQENLAESIYSQVLDFSSLNVELLKQDMSIEFLKKLSKHMSQNFFEARIKEALETSGNEDLRKSFLSLCETQISLIKWKAFNIDEVFDDLIEVLNQLILFAEKDLIRWASEFEALSATLFSKLVHFVQKNKISIDRKSTWEGFLNRGDMDFAPTFKKSVKTLLANI